MAAHACCCLLLGEANVVRAFEFEHLVQDADSEGDLRPGSAICMRAQPVLDDLLEPADVGLDQYAPMIA